MAPRDAALLLSLGFRPAWLAPDAAWRLAAIISLAMADAAEATAGLAPGTIRLKWPNDLVVEGPGGAGVRKLAGVLGETDGLGGPDPRVVVGIGINTDWAAADFPPELAASMTSLREIAGRRPIDQRRAARAVHVPADARRRGAARRGHVRCGRLGGPPADDRSRRSGSSGPTAPRPSARWAWTRRPGRSSSPTRACRVASAGSSSARSPTSASRTPRSRRRCNAMARPAFRKVDRPEEGGPRLAHLDRDRRLVEAAQADPARFEALYRKYLAQVYSYAFYELRDHHEAEDATERTFLAALANLGRFEERARPVDGEGASTFRVWLFQIARNAVAERRRRQRRRPEAPLEAAATIAAPIDLEADAGLRDEAAAALRAVERLPGDRRRALILRFVDEMTTAEIAGILGRSEGAVRVLIHRGLRSVARDLDDTASVTGAFAGRDGHEIDALVTDRYLEALLAAHARGADHAPAADGATRCHPPGRGPAGARTCPAATRRSASRRPSPPGWPRPRPGCGSRRAAGGEGLVVPPARAGSRSRRPRPGR